MTVPSLRKAAGDYLAPRRSFGFELDEPGKLGIRLADSPDAEGAGPLTVEHALRWATAPGAWPYWHWLRLSAARGFASCSHAIDARQELLPAGLLPHGYRRVPTFWFSDADTTRPMLAADARPSALHAATYSALPGSIQRSEVPAMAKTAPRVSQPHTGNCSTPLVITTGASDVAVDVPDWNRPW